MGNFTFPIHRMTPLSAPVYNVVKTQMEGWHIKRRLKSANPVRRWEVEIRGRTNSERDEIIAHWNSQKGDVIPFNWVVPTFWGGNTFYVTYEEMNYDNPPGLGNVWDFVIIFKEELV